MRLSLLALAILALAAPLAGQTTAEEILAATAADHADHARFALFTECAPVYLNVSAVDLSIEGSYDERIAAWRILRERAARLAESRLRGARLYAGVGDSDPYQPTTLPRLNVSIAFGNGPYTNGVVVLVGVVTLEKTFYDPASGMSAPHGVFRHESVDGLPRHLMQERLSEILDEFILQYLRVNEGYC